MTLEEAQKSIARIISCKRDAEAAHGLEDDLHLAFIKDIAEGNIRECDIQKIAVELLALSEVDFPRWCA